GVNHINCGLMENYSVAHTAQKLKELCHRAGKYTIGVEPMPYSGLPDVKKAWAVVKESGCENAKLILDSWHWVRADQPIDLALLEGIPAEKIVSVQINDVHDRAYAKSILRDESMHDRLAPGTGHGDTAAFCRMLREKGVEPKAMGVEVISDAILANGVAAAAKYNFDHTVNVLAAAWPEAMPEK
ncbi:MAG: sugar phosphate isomerase/epimerase, partial [Anaerotignum sp.]|nr:sugar phosphate isomerase/epimerase [Anaerotignum sp.]